MAADREIRLHNATDEHFKVCIYKAADPFDIVPVEGGVVFLDPRGKRRWNPSAAEKATSFHVKFFTPKFADKFRAGANPVLFDSTVTIHKDGDEYYVTVTRP